MEKKTLKTAGLTALAGLTIMGLVSCGPTKTWVKPEAPKYEATVSDGGNVINIRVWNTEFIGLFEKYYPGVKTVRKNAEYTIPAVNGSGTKTVKFIETANQGNAYQTALDNAIEAQANANADDKLDMFLFEADYALKYVNSNATLDVKDLGIKDTDTKDMYAYTKTIATADNHLKGLSWQATPGLFAYRTDIAEDVLGTSDPVEVQKKISDWGKFDAVAAQMKAKNYTMLSGYDDAYRVFSNNISKPLVDMETGKVEIDSKLNDWIKQTKKYTENGYNKQTTLWSTEWAREQSKAGSTFGFFYSTWGINFTLSGNAAPKVEGSDEYVSPDHSQDLYGKWRVCEGPASFYWGGSWIAAANGTDNKAEVANIMKVMTCDGAIAKRITEDTLDYTNNKPAMNELAESTTFGTEHCGFLGGQNHIALFAKSAEKISLKGISQWDQGINEKLQEAMKDYFAGTITEEKAWNNFYTKLAEVYPELMIDVK